MRCDLAWYDEKRKSSDYTHLHKLHVVIFLNAKPSGSCDCHRIFSCPQMMADSNSEEDGFDKNFILAKLVSIFGDSVEFDVINIVAQENEWNEAKCVESLTVLGEYKNPPSFSPPDGNESQQINSRISDSTADGKRVTASSSSSLGSMSQTKKNARTAATPKAARPIASAAGAVNKMPRVVQDRHPPPVPSSSPKPKERSNENQEHHDQVKNLISSGTPVLILLRGLPGSGKTTLSKQLLSSPGGKSGCICSADDFFFVPVGGKGQKEYRFDPLKLEDAHKHCRVKVLQAMAHGVTPIIVDNTNTQAWEMFPYVEMALEPWKAEENLRKMVANGSIAKGNVCKSLGTSRNSFIGKRCNCGYTVKETAKVPYQVELLEPLTWWYRNPSRLAKVNQHGVSLKKITQMLSHFEYGLTGKDLVKQILRKKPQNNIALHSEQQNKLSSKKVRPTKEKKQAHLSGPPLFSVRDNTNVNYSPNQFVFGNNQYPQSSAMPFANFVGFPPGPYIQPVLYSPCMFNVGTTGQSDVPKSHKVEMDSRKQVPLTNEGKISPSSQTTLFPGIRPSNIFSTQENEIMDSGGSGSENTSSKSDVIGPNPFLKSSIDASDDDLNASCNFEGECIEITEEEEQEWMQANASKYVDWKSSDEEESGDELIRNSSEPKPARSNWGRHSKLMAGNITEESPGGSGCQIGDKNEEVVEWVTEEVDHLSSWNIKPSGSNSGSPVETKNSREQVDVGPLPPRSLKKKVLNENSTQSTDVAEQLEKVSSPMEDHDFGWIKDVRLLLKALGLDKDTSDSGKPSLNEQNRISDTVLASGESNQENYNEESGSRNQDEMSYSINPIDVLEKDSDLNSFEVLENILSENSAGLKSENVIELVSPKAEIQGKNADECFVPFVKTVPLLVSPGENHAPEPSVVASDMSPGRIEENEQSSNLVVAGQPKAIENFSTVPETSGNSETSKVIGEDIGVSEVKNDVSKRSAENFCEEAGNALSEKSVHVIHIPHVSEERKIQNLNIQNSDSSMNCGSKSVSNLSNEKTETAKMSVITSLLMGIEKALKRSPEEFESGEKLPVDLLSDDLKSESLELQLEEAQPQVCDSEQSNDKSSIVDGHNEQILVVEETQKATHASSPPITAVDVSNKEPEPTVEFVEQCDSGGVKQLCDFDELPSSPNNQRLIAESMCEAAVLKDLDSSIISLLVSISSESSSSPSIVKHASNKSECKTGNLIDVGLSEEENNLESIAFANNQDNVLHPDSSYPSNSHLMCSTGSHPSDIQTNGTVSDLLLKEVGVSKESDEIIDEIENISQVASINPAQTPAQNLFGKAGNFLLDSFGTSYGEASNSHSEYSTLHNDVESYNISKKHSGKDSLVGEEESQTNINMNSMKPDGALNLNEDDDSDGEGTYPLVLDPGFVDLLYGTFGNPFEETLYESPKPVGSASGVTVNIPTSLARKLHECLLKSQWDSILAEEENSQRMLIEDELLARQLQELEKEDLKDERDLDHSSTTPNLREIMDMEKAMAMYNADQSKSILANQRNDMSTRLTWDLLIKEFPQVPQNIIAQIFSAYDYSYSSTREALLTSLPEYERDTHETAVKDVVSPEAIVAQEKVLLERAKMESLKYQQREMMVEEESEEGDEEADEDQGTWKEVVEEARKSAALNKRLQKERHAQAQAANRRGMASAAAYYCQMATLHKQKAEEETRKAANILSKVFTGRYGNSHGSRVQAGPLSAPPPTLDLHSMRVSEAITVTNAFLDAHIECLRAEKTRQPIETASRKSSPPKTKTLFLVTGRGMNSLGGIPRIKPAIEKQLENRGVWYEEMNPGLLRVMISANQQTKRKV